MIDKDKIFGLFDSENEGDGKVLINAPDSILEEGYAKIGMFTKLVQNHFVFHAKLKAFLQKEDPNYDSDNARENAEFAVYNRAFFYIRQLDLEKENHLSAFIEFKKEPFIKALKSSITYFESVEKYEKCDYLHKLEKLKNKV
jgi:hypothetical protein|tara:strand:- start:2236 stop:2661 length:426 start_codon:yes stop_codon:yes gene_type:complete